MDLSEKTDATMENTDNVTVMPGIGHNLSPVSNDVKRAKYDETIDEETPSTSGQDMSPKVGSTQMEVEEEPEIIEVSSFPNPNSWNSLATAAVMILEHISRLENGMRFCFH